MASALLNASLCHLQLYFTLAS